MLEKVSLGPPWGGKGLVYMGRVETHTECIISLGCLFVTTKQYCLH